MWCMFRDQVCQLRLVQKGRTLSPSDRHKFLSSQLYQNCWCLVQSATKALRLDSVHVHQNCMV
uniref:Uncharacterized protein n=1 Tax=Lotus japonicus TaxID=34305 RepID=I3SKS8_LOTJA|nr:unknown [Lotus japonicus]